MGEGTNLEIVFQDFLPEEHREAATQLMLDAFEDKLIPVLGKDARANILINKGMRPSNCISASVDGKLAGILAFRDHESGFIELNLRDIIRTYGLIGGLKKAIGLSLLDHHSTFGECYVDCIAVARDERGRGIGNRLLEMLEERARLAGNSRLTLAVIDTNTRAKALYHRFGFVDAKVVSMWPLDKLFGFPFKRVTYMEKRISRPSMD